MVSSLRPAISLKLLLKCREQSALISVLHVESPRVPSENGRGLKLLPEVLWWGGIHAVTLPSCLCFSLHDPDTWPSGAADGLEPRWPTVSGALQLADPCLQEQPQQLESGATLPASYQAGLDGRDTLVQRLPKSQGIRDKTLHAAWAAVCSGFLSGDGSRKFVKLTLALAV